MLRHKLICVIDEIKTKIFLGITRFINIYNKAAIEKNFDSVYENCAVTLGLIEQGLNTRSIQFSMDFSNPFNTLMREKNIDILATLKLYALSTNDHKTLERIDKISCALFNLEKSSLDNTSFFDTIYSSKSRLKDAIFNNKKVYFIIGHTAPDSDSVITSISEAYRLQIMDPESTYIAIVPAEKIPAEIKAVIKDPKLASSIVLTEDDVFKSYLETGSNPRYILVDEYVHILPEIINPQDFIFNLDHHLQNTLDAPKSLEFSSAAAILAAQKYIGLGVQPPTELARMLYLATLMDSENMSKSKVGPKDNQILEYLKTNAGLDETNSYHYASTMKVLLSKSEPSTIYWGDMHDEPGFNYAVVKKIGILPQGNVCEDNQLIIKLRKLQNKHHIDTAAVLSLLKLVDYADDCITINKERLYMLFNETADNEFKNRVYNLYNQVLKDTFGDNINIEMNWQEHYIEWGGNGKQLSRKVDIPSLQPLIKEKYPM